VQALLAVLVPPFEPLQPQETDGLALVGKLTVAGVVAPGEEHKGPVKEVEPAAYVVAAEPQTPLTLRTAVQALAAVLVPPL
jgi:hypothetical protein